MILNPYTITNEQLIMVIENHLKAELSVKYLAEYFGYSPGVKIVVVGRK